MKSEILIPAPFSPPLEEREVGPLFEIRSYTYQPGAIPAVIERWSEKIEARAKMLPIVGCFTVNSATLTGGSIYGPTAILLIGRASGRKRSSKESGRLRRARYWSSSKTHWSCIFGFPTI